MDEAPVETLASTFLCDGMSVFPKQTQSLFGEAEKSKVFKLERRINRENLRVGKGLAHLSLSGQNHGAERD